MHYSGCRPCAGVYTVINIPVTSRLSCLPRRLRDVTTVARHGLIGPLLAFSIVLLLLTACQSDALRRPEALLFEQLAGGQFTLHRDITIAPGHVRVIFQEGVASQGASEFKPRCELEVDLILDTPQTIHSGSYRIGKVRGMQRFVNRPTDRIMLAAVGDPVQLVDDTSNEWYMHTYWMQLQDERQTDAPTLTCGGAYNFAFYARYPTLQEMQAALGEHATLTPH
jgi:hypothetical protein